MTTHRFWLGASTLGPGDPAEGIRLLTVDSNGVPDVGAQIDVGPTPMFLAAEQNSGSLMVAHEIELGELSLHEVTDAGLHRLGTPVPTGKVAPCHVAITPGGAAVIAANYGGGVTVHSLNQEGLHPAATTVTYEGSGPNADRQESSHPHQILIDWQQRRLYVPDLGTDAVHVHELETLLAGGIEYWDLDLPAGAGPRHAAACEDRLLVANELDGTVALFNTESGQLLDACASTNAKPVESAAPSAIRVTRNEHVLVANRGPGTIGVLRLSADRDFLQLVGEYPCGGDHPRDFELTHDEQYLVVANQWSNEVFVFRFDDESGALTLTGSIATPSPACVARAR